MVAVCWFVAPPNGGWWLQFVGSSLRRMEEGVVVTVCWFVAGSFLRVRARNGGPSFLPEIGIPPFALFSMVLTQSDGNPAGVKSSMLRPILCSRCLQIFHKCVCVCFARACVMVSDICIFSPFFQAFASRPIPGIRLSHHSSGITISELFLLIFTYRNFT